MGMNKKIRIAMIGCGRISEVYRGVFKILIDTVEVVYAVDPKIGRAEDFAADFEGCTALSDYRDCFGKEIDVFHIATPHYLHPIIAIDAMKHGINVLTEKPMAITLADADRMIQVSEEEKVKLGVIFQTRYVKGCMKIKKAIMDGKIGKIISARSYLTWKREEQYYKESDWKGTWDKEGGGVLIDQAIHSIDRVQWLVGSKVDWIQGNIFNRMHPYVKVEDTADAMIHFENGCNYQLYASNCYAEDAPIEIEIFGEKGKAGLIQDLAWIQLNGQEKIEIKDGFDGLSIGPNYWGSSHITQIKDYYKSLLEGKKPFIDGKEGRNAPEIIRGIYKSSAENKKITLPFDDNL